MLLTCLFVGIGLVTAQTSKVTGIVVSEEDGQPIIGASVAVKGASVGAVSDIDGKFSISNVPSSAKTLVISYIGMITQEVSIKPNLRVVLKPNAQVIDEVVVVAYGTAKKSSFTGSASTVKSEQIEKRQVSNITNALSGQVAGVQVTSSNGQPGTTSTVRIRGVGSMAAGNSPLYVVDGVPFDGDIASINTADIETTTVLKDAASNALYGARGANGVILITTKKGTSREAVISVDAKWGTNSRGVSNYNVMKSPSTYLEKAYEAIVGTYSAKTPEAANVAANADLSTNLNGGVGYKIYTVPTGQSLIGLDGKINENATLGYSDGTYTYKPDDWYNELFDKGNLRQEYNVSISGSTDKLNYYMSGGYLDDSGLISGSGFARYSTRAKGDYQVKKWLKVGANMAFTNYDLQSPDNQTSSGSSVNLFYIANYIAPIYPMYVRDANGAIMKDSRNFTVYDFGDGTSSNFKRTWMSGSNPASLMELDKRQYIADVFSGRWYAAVDLMEGLKFTYNYGVDIDNTRYSRLYNAYYGQYSKVGGIAYSGSTRTASINHQQLLTYKKTFNNIHDIDILVGHETYDYQYKYLRGSKEKLYNPAIVEIDNAISNPDVSSYTDKYATEGWLARAQYDYDGKYIFSGSYRRDASSRFDPDNRWGDFGSFGAAWVLNKESFLQNQKWISFLKYKISYGIQGNDALLYSDGATQNYYPYQDQFTVSENNGDFATTQTYKGNKDITWETSYSFNTGFDFNLWDGKLSGNAEYFSRKTKDLLYYMPVAVSNGYSELPMNIGSVRNSGFEFDLNSELYKTNDIKLSVYFNATTLNNKIIELAPELNGELISGTRIYREGESMYQYYLRKYAGVDESGLALYYIESKDAAGEVTIGTTTDYNKATKYALGDILPDVYGGFGLNLNAYGFDFSASCAYQLGGKIIDSGYQSLMHSGSASNAGQNWHKDILNSWSTTNSTSNIPRVNAGDLYTNSTSDRFLISSNYLDVTNITLGYTLPKSLTTKLQINSLRFYVAGDNLALFAKRKGLDPRQSYTSAGGFRYAAVRTISGGVSLKF